MRGWLECPRGVGKGVFKCRREVVKVIGGVEWQMGQGASVAGEESVEISRGEAMWRCRNLQECIVEVDVWVKVLQGEVGVAVRMVHGVMVVHTVDGSTRHGRHVIEGRHCIVEAAWQRRAR